MEDIKTTEDVKRLLKTAKKYRHRTTGDWVRQSNDHYYMLQSDRHTIPARFIENSQDWELMTSTSAYKSDRLELHQAQPLNLTVRDVIDAVGYGFKYSTESQHSGHVPVGNILQWLMSKKGLIEVPKEFDEHTH